MRPLVVVSGACGGPSTRHSALGHARSLVRADATMRRTASGVTHLHDDDGQRCVAIMREGERVGVSHHRARDAEGGVCVCGVGLGRRGFLT